MINNSLLNTKKIKRKLQQKIINVKTFNWLKKFIKKQRLKERLLSNNKLLADNLLALLNKYMQTVIEPQSRKDFLYEKSSSIRRPLEKFKQGLTLLKFKKLRQLIAKDNIIRNKRLLSRDLTRGRIIYLWMTRQHSINRWGWKSKKNYGIKRPFSQDHIFNQRKISKKDIKPHIFLILAETKNNFIITCVNSMGNIITSFNAGICGFQGPKKTFPHAAYICGKEMCDFLIHNNMTTVRLIIKSRVRKKMREAIRGLREQRKLSFAKVLRRLPITHNGVRRKKMKRK